MKKFLLSTLVVVLTAFSLYAQVTTSSLTGTVRDAKESLIGATIKAIHTPTGTSYGASTGSNGKFTIPNMRTGGPYTIEITYIGYQKQSISEVNLKLGEPFDLNIVLNETGAELREVVITADRSKLNGNKTGAGTNISTQQINTMPTITRSISDLTRLTPQANGNSFGGRDGRFNNVQIDGANFNNGFGLNSNPLPGGNSQPISLDAIEELQVNIAPYDVKQGGFTGAGINAVTRSGTNQFSGSAYTFFRNENLVGYKVNGNDLPTPNSTSSKTLGFRLGGPIIKNKLFFFVNAETVKNEGTNPFAVNLWRPSDNGISNPSSNIARTRRTDLDAIKSHLINKWGYDPGTYEGYANDNGNSSTSFFGRIDWNINKNHRLAVRYSEVKGEAGSLVNGSSGPSPRSSVNRVSDQSMAFSNTMYKTENIVKSVTTELNSRFSAKLSNQFLATYSRIQDTRKSPSDIFPMVDIWDGTGASSNYMSFGYELFTFGNDVLNNNYNFINNLTYLADKHTITAGLSYESQKFGNQYIRLGTSYYRYASVADFLTTGGPAEVAPTMFGLTYPYEGQDPYAPIVLGTAGFYVQDKFSVNDKFDLTIGLRADMPVYMNDLTANSSIDNLNLLDPQGKSKNYTTGSWPKSRLMLSPRIGFNYDVLGDNTLKLRGGTGMFSGRVPFVWLTNMPSNSGVIQNNVEPNGYASVSGWIKDIRFNPDPYYWLNNTPASAQSVFIKNPKAGVPSSFALVDNDFKMPKVWRTSLGLDYKIPSTDLTLTGDFIYTKDINAAYQFGANRAGAKVKMNYSGDTRDFFPGGAGVASNPAVGGNTAVVLTNTDVKGHSLNATVGLSIPSQKGLYGGIYYTYTNAKDVSGNPGSNASSAWLGSPSINNPNEQILYNSQYSTPHRVVGSISYRIEYAKKLATTVSLFYSGSHQGRYSYTTNGDLNRDGINADLLYIPMNASEFNFKAANGFTVDQQRAAFDEFINNDKYLSTRRGKYAERNAVLLPWQNRVDVRILQDLFTNIGGRRNTLQFSADVMNFGNMLSSKWGIDQQLNNAQGLLNITNADITNTGVPTFTMRTVSENGKNVLPTSAFRDVTTTATTWYMQLGLRYSF